MGSINWAILYPGDYNTVLQSQKAVSAYFAPERTSSRYGGRPRLRIRSARALVKKHRNLE